MARKPPTAKSPTVATPASHMTFDQISEAAKAWDAAREAWKLATEAAATARTAHEELAVSGASDPELAAAHDAVLVAEAELALATKAVYDLVTAGDGVTLTASSSTNTPPSDGKDGGAGSSAGPAPQLGSTFGMKDDGSTGLAVLDLVLQQARDLAATGDLAAALAGLRKERSDLNGGFELLGKIAAALEAAIAELGDGGPVVEVTAKIEGRRRAGHQFGRTMKSIPRHELTDEQLTALKADPQLTVIEK